MLLTLTEKLVLFGLNFASFLFRIRPETEHGAAENLTDCPAENGEDPDVLPD